MEQQRPLRLGDIVDDYCPRERRVTNHAIVALVEDAIRQTRCTTCDTEHAYKNGREPKRRKKDGPAELYEEVLADAGAAQLVQPRAAEVVASAPESPASADAVSQELELVEEPPADTAERSDADVWPGHRQLIRATLPKIEGEQPPPRPIPEFTIYQRPQGRGGHARHAGGWSGFGHGRPRGNGNGTGNGQGRNGHGEVNGNTIGRPNGGRGGRHRGKHKRPR
jgi:hypothetical protein